MTVTSQCTTAGIDQRCRIATAAQDRLRRSKYHGVRRVSCAFDGDVLKLRGKVSTYYEKQIAQSLVLTQLDGAIHLQNEVEVVAALGGK